MFTLLYIVNVTTVLPIHYCIKQKFLLKIIKLYSIVYKVNGQDLLPIVSIFPLVPAFNIKSPTKNKHTCMTQISQNTAIRFLFFLVLALKKTEFWPLLFGYGRLLTTSFHSFSSLVEVRSEEWLQSRYSVYRCNCFQMWKTYT